jgi:hypothetical protein
MDSGNIYVLPGASLVIGSGIGAGLVLRGNSAIYNYGTVEIQRNLSLDNGWATTAKPNLIINATSSSVFKMSNQYLVINNPYSWFVNNGSAEFWGIITDNQSVAASVCLGNNSSTRMAMLINKVANAYTVPSGSACVNVYQWSQFYNPLTSSTNLLACVSGSYTSDTGCIPFGCQPNYWGAAQVFTNCTGCNTLILLETGFTSFVAKALNNGSNHLEWQWAAKNPMQRFLIQRSANGASFTTIDSIRAQNQQSIFYIDDKNPLPGNNYYMISSMDPHTDHTINSKIVNVYREHPQTFTFYPIPFSEKLFIRYSTGERPEKIVLKDVHGKAIKMHFFAHEYARQVELKILEPLAPGIFVIHIQTSRQIYSKTIVRQ